jgi:hypothetical protein
MGNRLDPPEERACSSCSQVFLANWPQRLCYRCKRRRSSKSICEVCGGRTNQTGYRRCGSCRYGPAPAARGMTSAELAWLSGIIEGEGSFVTAGRRFGAVRAVMTDKDVIDRLAAVSGVGTVYAVKARKPHHKQAWAWQVVRPPSIASLITAVAPFFSNAAISPHPKSWPCKICLHRIGAPSRQMSRGHGRLGCWKGRHIFGHLPLHAYAMWESPSHLLIVMLLCDSEKQLDLAAFMNSQAGRVGGPSGYGS